METIEFYKEKYSNHTGGYRFYFLSNIENCGKMYSKLFYLETFLKQNVNSIFCKKYGNDWKDLDLFKKIKKEKITFGFWVKLFDGQFHDPLYSSKQINIMEIFPNFIVFDKIKKLDRGLSKIYNDLNEIRKFRNDIFYFDYKIENRYNNNMQNHFLFINKLINEYIKGLSVDTIMTDYITDIHFYDDTLNKKILSYLSNI